MAGLDHLKGGHDGGGSARSSNQRRPRPRRSEESLSLNQTKNEKRYRAENRRPLFLTAL